MKMHMLVAILLASLIACAGCASNPDAAGQALSGVLEPADGNRTGFVGSVKTSAGIIDSV